MPAAGWRRHFAGPPDLTDREAAAAALAGRRGGLLWAVRAADGHKLAEWTLEAPPAWDAMVAANGRLYLSTVDGKVLCLAASRPAD